MTARGLLRIALLLALVPLVIKGTRSRFDPDDDMDDADPSMDPDADMPRRCAQSDLRQKPLFVESVNRPAQHPNQ